MRGNMLRSIQFLGTGGAFNLPTGPGDLSTTLLQSNMVITAQNGKRLLFDCGTDLRFSLQLVGLDYNSFDAIYISHLHSDHMGGLEGLLLNRLFSGSAVPRPRLYAEKGTLNELWGMLYFPLRVTTEGEMGLGDYVNPCPITMRARISRRTHWQRGITLQLVRNVHVPNPINPMYAYGMIIEDSNRKVYISGDTVFYPDLLEYLVEEKGVGTIFHDCETGFKTGVHAHYDELRTLRPKIRNKMWLYHYGAAALNELTPKDDGFLGFAQRTEPYHFL